MKVFACKRLDDYSGGLAIVAANSKEEAFNVLHSDKRYDWMVDWYFDDEQCRYVEDLDKSDSYYYKRKNWFEMPMLTANVSEPQVLEEGGYAE